MKIEELIQVLEKAAPLSLQESYDNSGLTVGDAGAEVNAALITLDVTEEVMKEAMDLGCGLVISHHPLIFNGLKRLTNQGYVERIISMAIKNDLSLYAMHTNLDNVKQGVNQALATKLGLKNQSILKPLNGMLNKLVTFCPSDHAEKVRLAIFDAGAGHIGNYDQCSFNAEGLGSFRAGEHATPYVGEVNKMHFEKEVRIETIFPAYVRGRVIAAMKQAHPYEEVAFDIYPLDNAFDQAGAGMIGALEQETGETDFLEEVKKVLGTGCIKHSHLLGRPVKKVALSGGSGSFLIPDAIRAGADMFITGDIKYHQFFDGDGQIVIVDAGHYETEQFTKELIFNILKEKFPKFALRISKINTNSINYL